MNDTKKSKLIEALKEFEFDSEEKINYIIYEMKLLILNAMIDVLEKLNETNEDQMRHQSIFTCT
jgi:hypothetical protein